MSDINERAALLFDMLDTDNSKSLEKREILKAMRDNKKVRKIIETSRSLEALLHPAKYKKMFGEINTTSDGHITLEEFSNFIKSAESGAKREQKDLPADRGQNTEATIAKGSGTTVQDVNQLLKQFEQMRKMMKTMNKMGGQKALRNLLG